MRKNNLQDMTITEQFEVIKEKICDDVCRYRVMYLEKYKDPDEAWNNLVEHQCTKCPLERL